MYFEKFPKIEYNGVVIPDISIRYKINNLIRNSINVYEVYRITENEKPEDVSYKVYGDVTFHWVILLMNDIVDPFGEWYRNDTELDAYVAGKYDDPSAVHHYEDTDGYVVGDDLTPGTITYTNTEYEALVNDARREVKVLRPEYLPQLINEFETTIDG